MGVEARNPVTIKLNDSELRYRRLFESAQDGILILDAESGAILDVNPFLVNMLGYSRDEFVERRLWEIGAIRDIETSQKAFRSLQKHECIRYENLPLKAKDGRLIHVEFVSNVYQEGRAKVIQCNIRDISKHMRLTSALKETEKMYQGLVNQNPNGIFFIGDSGNILVVNEAMCQVLGYSKSELLAKTIWDIIPPGNMDLYKEKLGKVLDGESIREAVEYELRTKDGQKRYVEIFSFPRYMGQDYIGSQGIALDITTRKAGGVRIRQLLDRLTAMSAIDRFITANFDLELSLTEILSHVTAELGVDAADVLILNPQSQQLEYAAKRGFRSEADVKPPLHLDENYAGRIILERQLIQIPNLNEMPDDLFLKKFLTGHDFMSYYGIPLVTKGKILGVLEVFNRVEMHPDIEWFEFLNALAGQAAIAIENFTLFQRLQRSNSELTLAYDSTIEGWALALELRDKETKGHTQRVTEMAVRLARVFGLSEAELVQVRWGALLHDIGKMGIPDSILHKPGPLSGEEWRIMKNHPLFAYDMLSPIRYLRQALDIPCYHHEKWDGTGYAHGLKGEHIPLIARIFSVVDVWDAMRSDRVYRAAWSDDKVLDHIRSLSGTHFDPRVVDAFLRVLKV